MRKRSRALLSNAAALGALLTASPAFAHIDLIDPPARAHGTAANGDMAVDVNTDQKLGPCGQVTNGRTDRVTTYAPGETITVRVAEETNHDSYIRVAIDLDGDDDFVVRQPVAPATQIPPETQDVAQAAEETLDSEHLLSVFREANATNGTVIEIPVTLPDETCENCTLQVIQLMYNTGQIYYYQCADIVIAEVGGTSDPDAGAGGSANAGDAGAAGAAGAGGAPSSGNGGTSSAAGTGSTPPANGGAGGASSAGTGGGTAPAAGTGGAAPVASDDDDDGGCTISTHTSTGTQSAGLFGLLALGVGLIARRRR
jgi:MYXO-CTERM domain-containing protein